jgi:alkylhydroperoxidase family enzyme
MAYIRHVPGLQLSPDERVPDPDNIIQVHAIHPAVMRHHHALYRAVMHGPGPLSRREREMMAVRVSAMNGCRY